MTKKKPRTPSSVVWSVREVVEPGTLVTSVACGNGSVIIGGAHLYRVRPGGWGVQLRHVPEGTELPISIAVEPRSPFRIAVGPESGDVVVFTDTTTSSSIIGHSLTEVRGSRQAVQLSWVVNEGQSTLFALSDDGELFRMQAHGWDTLEIPPIRAIAHDERGTFAALAVIDGLPKAYLTHDGGDHFHFRNLGVDIEAAPDAPASLAVAGTAVAACVGDSGPLVSRGAGTPTRCHPSLGRAYTLAFQGPEPDAWLYVGLQRNAVWPAEVWIVDVDDNESKMMDFHADDREPLDLGAIAWDTAREALFISCRGGLIAMAPEGAPKPRKPRVRKKPLPQ